MLSGLASINHRHVIDLAVAAKTTDPAINMRRVVKIDVVGRAMDLHPADRLARFPTGAHRFEFRIVLLHLAVAVHARLRVRQIGVRGDLDETMAVTAIHPELESRGYRAETAPAGPAGNPPACISALRNTRWPPSTAQAMRVPATVILQWQPIGSSVERNSPYDQQADALGAQPPI